MGERILEVVGIAGSLRRASFNRALLKAAAELAPASLHITIHDLADVPMYNADVEAVGLPAPVARLKEAVGKAQGLLISSPEYNYGVSGVLKNTIDWLSRPPRASVLAGKPAAIMGASTGMSGTARGQQQLRLALIATHSPTMTRPEVLVAKAPEKFSAEGQLTDEATRDFLRKFLEAFADFVGRQA
jgi:chromate reductase